ncbi:cullin-associated NEDD8-dissociated protein 1 [Tanacetum coccineum]
MLEVDLQMSSANHPQTDGQTKVVNKTLECYLSSTKTTPIEIVYGQTPSQYVTCEDGECRVEVVDRTLMLHGSLIRKFKKGILSLLLIHDKDVLKEKLFLAAKFNYNILLCLYAIFAPVLSAAGDRYYKVTTEALRVCRELVRVVRPNIKVSDFDFKPYICPLYNAIMSRLTNQDQDQECAISCIGLVVFTFGDHITANLPACLPVIMDQMGNEVTRLTAMKGLVVGVSRFSLFIIEEVYCWGFAWWEQQVQRDGGYRCVEGWQAKLQMRLLKSLNGVDQDISKLCGWWRGNDEQITELAVSTSHP